MADAALFRPLGPSTYAPTDAAVSAWDPRIVHGAAVTALLAGQLAAPDRTLARLTVEFLAPVPLAPLVLERGELIGGRRAQRQRAVLSHEGKPVMTATALLLRRDELDLPGPALAHESPFPAVRVPSLDRLNRKAASVIGRESFDSESVFIEFERPEGDQRVHQWIRLALPVVEGTEISPLETAAVAADYAQSGVHKILPLGDWTFRNAELTLHLAREPVGTWVGSRCESVVQPAGAGFNASDLFDAGGRMGRSAASIIIEPRGAKR